MFGFELQISSSYFVADGGDVANNVGEREVAYRSSDGKMTLEGDETRIAGAKSELEFVTAPCRTKDEAELAVAQAAELAEDLLALADLADGRRLRFRAGDKFSSKGTVRGTWARDCVIVVGRRDVFAAKPQGTVGVPLAELGTFFARALQVDPPRIVFTNKIIQAAQVPNTASPDLRGFFAACHYFLGAAWLYNDKKQMVDEVGGPRSGAKESTGMWRTFEIEDAELKNATFEGRPAFYNSTAGACRVRVNRDSPKSDFAVLHRTDFCSMFAALPAGEREALVKLGGLPSAVWPFNPKRPIQDEIFPDRIFRLPYRADPPDPARPAGAYAALVRPKAEHEAHAESWSLALRGPTLDEWWHSVMHGQLVKDPHNPNRMITYAKDLASPPPGIRGRHPDRISEFPTDQENKNEYYGMGAFPMDPNGDGPPLAVFEHRMLDLLQGIVDLGDLTPSQWVKIVTIFHKNFVFTS